MLRRFRITVDGRRYDVVVEEIAGEAAAAAPAAPAIAVAASATPPSGAEAGRGQEIAPLGGLIESVHVVLGEAVAAGTKIVTIEAMKMKTEVFARGAGTVAAIAVKPGDAIDAGGLLLTLAS